MLERVGREKSKSLAFCKLFVIKGMFLVETCAFLSFGRNLILMQRGWNESDSFSHSLSFIFHCFLHLKNRGDVLLDSQSLLVRS